MKICRPVPLLIVKGSVSVWLCKKHTFLTDMPDLRHIFEEQVVEVVEFVALLAPELF